MTLCCLTPAAKECRLTAAKLVKVRSKRGWGPTEEQANEKNEKGGLKPPDPEGAVTLTPCRDVAVKFDVTLPTDTGITMV